MTVPAQRGDRDGPTVDSLILGAIDDLKGHVVRLEAQLGQRLESFAQQFLPRGEYEARHSDVRNLVTRQEARIDAESAERKARMDALEEKLTQQRRFAVATFISALVLIVGLLGLIFANLPT